MNTLRVKAAPGIKFPVEGKWRDYLTEEAARTVPDTPYYRRALVDGDLLDASEPASEPAAEATKSAKK